MQTFFKELAKPTAKSHQLFEKAENGPQKTKSDPLSQKRLRTVLTAFKNVMKFGCDEYSWTLPSPFDGMSKHITDLTLKQEININVNKMNTEERNQAIKDLGDSKKQPVKVMLFSEYQQILSQLHPLIKPAAELMILTSLIPSEVGALKNEQISSEYLIPKLSLSRGVLKNSTKNPYRERDLPITHAVRRILDEALAQAEGPFLFRSIRGGFFNERIFRRQWYKACRAAEVEEFVPYALRHSFVANCEILDMPKYRIIDLAGHADKSMVDRVYGKYRQGMERERDLILAYYGEDFVDWKDETATSSRENKANGKKD